MIFLSIVIFLFVCYCLVIIYFAEGWRRLREFESTVQAAIKISVIIPARNEELHITALLESLRIQTYPKELFEVIVIDDHSNDRTAELASSFPDVTLLKLDEEVLNSYKKKAIEKGIAIAGGDLIVTTDADCIVPSQWLQKLAAFRATTDSVFIAAPVKIDYDKSLVQIFQSMDFMVLQGITGAAVSGKKLSMCNGANLAFDKKVFNEVGGYAGISDIASGDDMLLMHKFEMKYPGRAGYLRSEEAIVRTAALKTWKDFLNQRIRWASKAKVYNDARILPVLALVYLFNLSFLALFVAGFFTTYYWKILLLIWVGKTLIELLLVIPVMSFFKSSRLLLFFFLFQPLHVVYTLVSGFFGQFGKYEWKGRRVN